MWRAIAFSSLVIFPLFASAQAADRESDPSKGVILVLPFEIAPGSTGMWIARAAQEDLMTDLTQATLARVKKPADPRPVRDVEAALKLGREFHATAVIFGQVQVVDLTARLTGQVLDVASGNALGALKVTGPLNDVFDLEDALAHQTLASLPQDLLKPDVLEYLRESSVPAIEPPQLPLIQIIGQPMTYREPDQLQYAPISTLFNPIVPPSSVAFLPVVAYEPVGFAPVDLYSSGYPGIGYPFGWAPAAVVVITNVNSGVGDHHEFRNHSFRWHGRVHQDGGSSTNGAQLANQSADGVVVRFNWGGVSAPGTNLQGGPTGFAAGLPLPFIPQTTAFSPTAIPQGGFVPMRIPRFGFGFQNQIRGGSVTR